MRTTREYCIHLHSNTGFTDDLLNSAAGGGGYGQNIAAGVKADNISRVITDLFYNGEVNLYEGLYGQATPDFTNFVHWGHFSQVVWKQTSVVGCAVQYCPAGLSNTGSNIAPYFTVCNYGPPGNYIGEFGDNVGDPMGLPSANWNTGL
nr:putative pathogenesis-related protein [Quercus suber]